MRSDYTRVYDVQFGGFVHVAKLGEGLYGCAILVRSLRDGKLYVRKEDLDCVPADGHRSNVIDSDEVRNAMHVGRLIDVPECKGWIRYADQRRNLSFGVSYWEYYFAGTLCDAPKRSMARNIMFPESWIFHWLSCMLDTILNAHIAGVTHRDAHMNNWFLTRKRDEEIPSIGLGDWGCSQVCDRLSGEEWFRFCRKDFVSVAAGIFEVFAEQPHSSRVRGLIKDIVRSLEHYQRPADFAELHKAMDYYPREACKAANTRERPTRAQEGLIPRQSKYEDNIYCPSSDSRAAYRAGEAQSKKFEVAKVEGRELKIHGAINSHFVAQRNGGWRQNPSSRPLFRIR
ncbi:Serine/threonine-protein kinase Nek1 [Lithohypha guttulata]|uniref:Serine/threonine-protein kinase Nek1 n=1 Tax=Lithohypha guttulata TaxID=1690604 RepID=A0AAN7T3M4_9EURO|nr:Serine/threonine-protein kinase Nek1 [Lithohypha guttulata]